MIFSGAGAGAVACGKMFMSVGIQKANIFLCDRQGVVTTDRKDLEPYRGFFAQSTKHRRLEDAVKDADIFVGLSSKDLLSKAMLASMAPNAIVFALANPDPEIGYHEALSVRKDIIMATGRSDFPNQVNNVLGFPFVFRGALDVRATKINEAMKLAAARALAELTKEPVPLSVCQAYRLKELQFGPDYIIPKPLDPRVLLHVAPKVAQAAMDSGAATQPIVDFEEYHRRLHTMLENKFKRDDAMEENPILENGSAAL